MPDERQRVAAGVGEVQPVEHPAAGGVAVPGEQVEPGALHRPGGRRAGRTRRSPVAVPRCCGSTTNRSTSSAVMVRWNISRWSSWRPSSAPRTGSSTSSATKPFISSVNDRLVASVVRPARRPAAPVCSGNVMTSSVGAPHRTRPGRPSSGRTRGRRRPRSSGTGWRRPAPASPSRRGRAGRGSRTPRRCRRTRPRRRAVPSGRRPSGCTVTTRRLHHSGLSWNVAPRSSDTRAHRGAHPLEVGLRGRRRPVDLEVPLAQPHHAVRDVAAHAQQRQRAVGQAPGPDQRADVGGDAGLRRPAEPAAEPVARRTAAAGGPARAAGCSRPASRRTPGTRRPRRSSRGRTRRRRRARRRPGSRW